MLSEYGSDDEPWTTPLKTPRKGPTTTAASRHDSGMNRPQAAADDLAEWRKWFAECWGTFLLVLVAACCGVERRLEPDKVSAASAAVAPGLMVMVVIYFMGDVSGAHINPAVTLAFAVRRNFPWRKVPGYVAAQLGGALLAGAASWLLFGANAGFGVSRPADGFSDIRVFLVEILLAAGLVNTILGTASGARNVGPNAAIAVGAYIALADLWGGPISSASMNPARSLGPALVLGDLSRVWIFILGPVLGALVGAIFEWLLKGPPTREGAKAAQGDTRS